MEGKVHATGKDFEENLLLDLLSAFDDVDVVFVLDLLFFLCCFFSSSILKKTN